MRELFRFEGLHSIVRPDSGAESWHHMTCAHCGGQGAAAVIGFVDRSVPDEEHPGNHKTQRVKWLLCTTCGDGSVVAIDGKFYPGVRFGPDIEGLPSRIAAAYDEARNCMSVAAYSACELMCRSIVAYTSLDKVKDEQGNPKAKIEDSFRAHVTHIQNAEYITEPMRSWVLRIRDHGGEQAHTLIHPTEARAKDTLMFTAELLRLVYELEHLNRKYDATDAEEAAEQPDA